MSATPKPAASSSGSKAVSRVAPRLASHSRRRTRAYARVANALARALAESSSQRSYVVHVNGSSSGPAAARDAGLHYVTDQSPGITRRWANSASVYFDPRGRRIESPEEIRRLNALAIPPAYSQVWICPDPQGHLRATGRDARARKQYRYHPRWREVRDATKYERMTTLRNRHVAVSGASSQIRVSRQGRRHA